MISLLLLGVIYQFFKKLIMLAYCIWIINGNHMGLIPDNFFLKSKLKFRHYIDTLYTHYSNLILILFYA